MATAAKPLRIFEVCIIIFAPYDPRISPGSGNCHFRLSEEPDQRFTGSAPLYDFVFQQVARGEVHFQRPLHNSGFSHSGKFCIL